MPKIVDKHPVLLGLATVFIFSLPLMYLRDYSPAIELPILASLGGNFARIPVIALSLIWFFLFFGLITGILDKFSTLLFSRRDYPRVRYATAVLSCAIGLAVWIVLSTRVDSLTVLWAVPAAMALVYMIPASCTRLLEFIFLIVGLLVTILATICYFIPTVADIIPFSFLGTVWMIAAGLVLMIGSVVSVRRHDRALKGVARVSKAMPVLAFSSIAALCLVSFLSPEINDWTGYSNLSSKVADTENVYTLATPGAKYLHLFTGRDVNDFEDNVSTFLMSSPRDGKLIVKSSFLGKSEELQHFLEGQEFCICGPYSVYTINKTVKEARKQDRQNRRSVRKES